MDATMDVKQSTKCFGYLRVSGLGQCDGDGFTRQRQAIEAYASAHGYVVERFFEERGVSGTTESLDRPAFSEMLEALFANGIKTVLIERLDRFARDLMIQERLIADFKKQGVVLISAAEPDLCADDAGRVAIRQMMGVFAQYERSSITTLSS
jgi:DNA invertase Pin-like site-specific DNA recombinase